MIVPPSDSPSGTRIVIGSRVFDSGQSVPASAPAQPEEKVDRWMPIHLFGCSLGLRVKGGLGEGHLLDGDPMRLDQTCLALEALMLTALTHDPRIREAAQKIRDARPELTDGQVMARLFPYLEFTPTSVSIYRPIPEMRTVPAGEFEPYHFGFTRMSGEDAEEDLQINTPGLRDFSRLGDSDALRCGYRAFLKHHGGGQAPGHSPQEDLARVWGRFQAQHGSSFPFEDYNARHILRRLFERFQIEGARDGGVPTIGVVPLEGDDGSSSHPISTIRFSDQSPSISSLS